MSTTLAGRWSTAVGKGKRLLGDFALSFKDILAPILESTVAFIDSASKFVKENKKIIVSLGSGIATMIAVAAAVGGLSWAFRGLTTVLLSNPILAVIALLAGLIVALEQATDLGGGFGETLSLAYARLKLDAKSIARLFTDLGKIIGKTLKALEIFAKTGNSRDIKKLPETLSGLISGLGTYNSDEIKQYEKDVLAIVGRVKKAMPTAANIPEIQGALNFDFGGELKKLQAEGVVSSNLKVFNINISNLTGVGTLSTTNIESGIGDVGDAVNRALLESLADIKELG